MPKKKKKKTKKTEADPIGSFVSAEPNIKPSEKKKLKKNKKKTNGKDKKSKKKTKETKPKTTKYVAKIMPKKKKKATKQTKSAKSNKDKKKKKAKNKKKNDKKSKSSKNSKGSKKNPKPKKDKSQLFKNMDLDNKSNNNTDKDDEKAVSFKEELQKQENNESKPQENTESKPQEAAKFPWSNWKVEEEQKSHNTRRSSLGSIRELHIQRAKKTGGRKKRGGHRKKSQKQKKHSKKKDDKHNIENSIKDVDIYDPQSKKKQRRKEKKHEKFKVVPKHHIKRSSLPTYQSAKRNNPHLRFLVKKETDRNLASLYDQPEKRKKIKELKNMSRGGFVMHVNHRYRLEDGRIGVCKYRGRTQFGKSSEDWIGLVLNVGVGEHDGTVQGKTYFRCRDGKGIFVRPYDVVQDMGSQNKMLSKQDIKLAEANIKRYKKKNEKGTTTSADVIEKDQYGNAINPDHGYDMMNEKFYNPKTLLDKNKGKKAAKKKHHTQV